MIWCYRRLSDAAWWRGISALPIPSRHPQAWGVLWLVLHPVKTARLLPRWWSA